MLRQEINKVNFLVALISEFSQRFGIKQKQAFNYINRYKGLTYYDKHYDVLHTFSFNDAIDAIRDVCSKNGGGIQ
ncbi:MAG: DUF3791 domain-containing protein [Bacteroidales bacterium]|nr:DUF3791 domain-containing protein [Bacteroidales bacterium]